MNQSSAKKVNISSKLDKIQLCPNALVNISHFQLDSVHALVLERLGDNLIDRVPERPQETKGPLCS